MVKKKTENKTEDSNQEDEEQKAQKDQEFVSFALRQPKTGPYEHLLSEFLAQAVITTDPLKRTKVVCEASLFVPEPKREELAIDYEKIEVLNVVANALLNVTVTRVPDSHIDLVSVPWGFRETEENFKKFLEPWFKCQVIYWPTFLKNHCKWHRKWSFPYDIVIDEIIREPLWSWFFDASTCLSPDGYASLRGSFVSWAIPQVQQCLCHLTGAVDPSLYTAILGVYDKRARKDYSEKVNEKADRISKKEGASENEPA